MNDFTNFSSSKSNAELGSEIFLKNSSGSIGVALEILGGRGPLLVRGKIAGNNFGAVKTGLQWKLILLLRSSFEMVLFENGNSYNSEIGEVINKSMATYFLTHACFKTQ